MRRFDSHFLGKRLTMIAVDMPRSDLNFVKFSRSYSYSKYIYKIDSPAVNTSEE
jgi:hypothetical protein